MKRILLALLLFSAIGIKAQDLCNLPNATSATDTDLFLKEGASCIMGTKSITYKVLFHMADSLGLSGVDTIYRKPGKDSIFFLLHGKVYAILDSIGGGGGVDTSTYPSAGAASNYTLGVQLHDTALTLGRLKDSNQKASFTTPYYVKTQINDTASKLMRTKDTNAKAGAATIYYVATHGSTNYLADTLGGAGSKPSLLTNVSGLVIGGNALTTNKNWGTTTNTTLDELQNNRHVFHIGMGSGGNATVELGDYTPNDVAPLSGGTGTVYIGTQCGYSAYYGSSKYSLFAGYNAAYKNGEVYSYYGDANVALGAYSFYKNDSSRFCTTVGDSSLYKCNSSSNTALGYRAGYTCTTGSNNIFLGVNDTGKSATTSNDANVGNAKTQHEILWGGTHVLKIQHNTATSGTVVSDGSEVLSLEGAASSLTITAPTSPYDGQLWEIITNQTSITIGFTTGATFNSAPTVVTKAVSVRFIYNASTTSWANNP